MSPEARRGRDAESRRAPENYGFFGKPKANRTVVSEVIGGRWYDFKFSKSRLQYS